MSEFSGDLRLADGGVAGQALPECGEHCGKCARCGVEIKSNPSRKRKQGEARRKRRTISIRVPDDFENGGEIWDEAVANVKDRLVEMGLYSEEDTPPVYECLIAAIHDWLT